MQVQPALTKETAQKLDDSSKDVILSYECDAPSAQQPPSKSKGRWTLEEEEAYLEFMKENRNDFLKEYCRRSKKIFERMSAAPNMPRGGEQCRSHHQKMCLKTQNGTIDEVIHLVQRRVDKKKKNLHVECQYDKHGHSIVSILDYTYTPMGKI